jgi:hypothetical protein
MRGALRVGWSLLTIGVLCACTPKSEQAQAEGHAVANGTARDTQRVSSQTGNAQPTAAAQAGRVARIEAGPMRVGSRPGIAGRHPEREADLVAVAMPSFEIDRLPYPNDPQKPPLTGVDRARATALCAEHGKRLCHELEWERACAGSTGRTFATGESLDVTKCTAAPASCESAEGVADLGVRLLEWTASDFGGAAAQATDAVVRGAAGGALISEHRCAVRTSVAATESQAQLGFRCCRGDATAPSYPATTSNSAQGVRPLSLSQESIRKALASTEALAAFAADFTPFTTSDVEAALRKGKRSRQNISVWQIQPAAFAWSPVAGEELQVVTGRAKGQALLVLLYPLADGNYAHAASTIVKEPEATFALGYSASTPDQLLWTTCYGCPAEGGTIRYEVDGRVTLSFR